MMELFVIALKTDWLRLKGYLKKNRGIKLLVIAGFGLVFLGVGIALYWLARQTALMMVIGENEMIKLTGRRMLDRGLSWLFIAGLATSWFSLKANFSRGSRWQTWLTKPIGKNQIFNTVYYRLLISSLGLTLGLAWPLLIAFKEAGVIGTEALWRGLAVVGGLTLVSLSLAAWIFLKGLGLVIIAWVVMGYLGIDQPLYHSLSAFWLEGQVWGLSLFPIFLILKWMTNRELKTDKWIKRWLNREIRVDAGLKRPVKHLFYSPDLSITLMNQDFLALIRNGTEIKYLLMLLGMGGVFYLTLNSIPIDKLEDQGLISLIQVIAGVSLGYLMTTWAGRFIFPLMSRRAPWLWLGLASPVKRIELLDSKLGVGVGLTMPWVLLALLTSTRMVGRFEEWGLYAWILIATIVAIGCFQALAGLIWPALKLAKHPDQVSTSYGGLVAVTGSLLISITGMMTWYGIQFWGWTQAQWWFWLVTLFGIILFLNKAIRSVKQIN